MDQHGDCMFVASRRGTYARRKHTHTAETSNVSTVGASRRHERPPVVESTALEGQNNQSASALGVLGRVQSSSSAISPISSARFSGHSHRQSISDESTSGHSLAGMFEEFVEAQDRGGLGIILFGEASPLTFALGEYQGKQAHLHDTSATLSKHKRMAENRSEEPASRFSPQEIEFLEMKGAFTPPEPQTLNALLDAFLTRFHPLYTIVNKAELLSAHSNNNIPWIMLHAICLIGATFCDVSLIHRTNFSSRAQARLAYYGKFFLSSNTCDPLTDNGRTEKAKILWSMNYETDKFVLLQTVLMLSFFGPRMNSIYNACSWLGFAFTIAESMGIHRSTSALDANSKDKGRMKRLWWTLVVRDAYCAALLGRPFRINIPQCDVPMLEPDDFDDELDDCNHHSALYQSQVARLSVITRTIVQRRFHSCDHLADTGDLQQSLAAWKAQVPVQLLWMTQASNTNVFATSLKLLYQQHEILLHYDPRNNLATLRTASNDFSSSANTALTAAQAIASSVSTLVTKHMINRLPHEVFTGFFMSGIVYHRQLHSPDPVFAEAARASLDNCQMLLHEICGSWDPAHWSVQIFDFLLSFVRSGGDAGSTAHLHDQSVSANAETDMTGDCHSSGYDDHGFYGEGFDELNGWDPPNLNVPGMFNDFLLMPNFFAPSV
jgi:hypothetical protein